MKPNEKIRELRESLNWSQEKMAEMLNLTGNGYAKIERGETKLYLDRLEQIAQIFSVNITELLPDTGWCVTVNENGVNNNQNIGHLHNSHYYGNSAYLVKEVEKLQAIIEQKDILLAEKERQIQMLENYLKVLQERV